MLIIASNAPAPKRIRKSKQLLGVSAITFLTLCVWVGRSRLLPRRCRRHRLGVVLPLPPLPTRRMVSLGFIEGLCGSRRHRRY
jgi:hypothetical protein